MLAVKGWPKGQINKKARLQKGFGLTKYLDWIHLTLSRSLACTSVTVSTDNMEMCHQHHQTILLLLLLTDRAAESWGTASGCF